MTRREAATASGWDAMADAFDTDVFDPTGTDLEGAFGRALGRIGRIELAVDLGCGTGRLLPRLLRQANHVVGIDFARELLDVGRARLGENARVRLRCADLTHPLRSPRGADLTTCSNVLLAPDEGLRLAILRNCRRVLAPGGRLLLIVPSLESALWVNDRLVAWNRRAGLAGARAFRGGIGTDLASARDLLMGIVDQGGVRTKHFLREELEETVRSISFELVAIERIEYAWSDYFEQPPKWLGATGPWDWLVEARRPA